MEQSGFITVKLNELELDGKNPRIAPDNNTSLCEEEIITFLLNEDVLKLADEIAKNGLLKTNTISVINENNKYTVIDGNRRTLALKLLTDPDAYNKYLNPQQLKKLTRIKNRKNIDSVDVYVFKERSSAEKEMAHIHLDGQSMKTWKLLKQYEYFFRKISKENISIIELANM